MCQTRRLMFAVSLPLAMTACGDDPVVPEDQLTEEEAEALLRGTMTTLWTESAVTHVSEDSVVVRCQQGGRITGAGELPDEDISGDTVRLAIDYRFTPSGCVVTGAGKEFTLNGNPSFRYRLFLESIGSTRENTITGGFSGGVKWQMGDRSGNCAMDLTLTDPEVADGMIRGSYDGKLCGHEVELDAAGLLPPDF